ncbi:fumarylacetoacetase [Vibrio lentus]
MFCHIEFSSESGFGLENLPYGVFSRGNLRRHIGVRVGNHILDLTLLEEHHFIRVIEGRLFNSGSLNLFASKGEETWCETRETIKGLLTNPDSILSNIDNYNLLVTHIDQVKMELPFDTRGYTDFFSSENHARNVGSLFRNPENALNINWKHLPVAYNGRASTIMVSGTPIVRPSGLIVEGQNQKVVFQKSTKLDYEIEMGFFVGTGNEPFNPIPVEGAISHIFGMCLVNDWSARDIQQLEYVPLGPFLGKSFATSISPWVVPMSAIDAFKVKMPSPDTPVADYLNQSDRYTYDINIELDIITQAGHVETIATTNFKHQYWSISQQLAHHTINGCSIESGDLLATGTLSGDEKFSWGSLLEKTFNGKEPVILKNGESRYFLEDGDTITIRAYCINESEKISFGEVTGKVC